MIKVLMGGVFDIIHPGHIYSLKLAKQLGDELVVVIANDMTVKRSKKKILHNQNQRKELISSLKIVDTVEIGHPFDQFRILEKIKPNIIALGYDQKVEESLLIQESNKLGLNIKIVRLSSIYPKYSSNKIRSFYDVVF